MNFTTVGDELPRDRWGRPLVTPPDGGKPIPYTRCTTFVSALDDTHNLTKWKQRMTAIGLAEREDLLLAVAAHQDDKSKLNSIVDEAMDAAKAGAAATTGTALHALTEAIDRHQPLTRIPGEYRDDLRAYRQATKKLTVEREYIERFLVNDHYHIGGTPDRIVGFEGQRYIADIKTGSVEWGALKIAQQLAVYAHSVTYDHVTGERGAPLDVNLERGIIIHLPAGTGTCTLKWVDIAAGWEAVTTSDQVRRWRSRKGWLTELNVEADNEAAAGLSAAIAACTSEAELTQLYYDHLAGWDDGHTIDAKQRKAELRAKTPTATAAG